MARTGKPKPRLHNQGSLTGTRATIAAQVEPPEVETYQDIMQATVVSSQISPDLRNFSYNVNPDEPSSDPNRPTTPIRRETMSDPLPLPPADPNHVIVVYADARDRSYTLRSISEGKALVKRVMGQSMTDDELGRFAGSHPGDHVVIQPWQGDDYFRVELYSLNRSAFFMVSRRDNDIFITSPNVTNLGQRSVLSGSDIIDTLLTWRDFGVTKVSSEALRDATHNGYEVWAKIGFHGEIPESRFVTNQFGQTSEVPIREPAQQRFGEHITQVEHLVKQRGGLAWWREHGGTWWATLDLHPGSEAIPILERLQRHQHRQG